MGCIVTCVNTFLIIHLSLCSMNRMILEGEPGEYIPSRRTGGKVSLI